MQCTQCGHINQSGKYCVKCGASLEAAAASEALNPGFGQQAAPAPAVHPVQDATSAGPNPQLQQVKQMSSQYFSYFFQVLQNPVRVAQTTNEGHMANGIITLFLFCLILPLIVYFQARASLGGFLSDHIPFGTVVVKPFFFLLLVVLMVNSIIYFVLKLGNVVADYRAVTARFGTFMIPSVTFLFVSLLFSIIKFDSEVVGWVTGIGVFSWFVAICFAIYSFKKDHSSGLDAFWGVIITYASSILLLYVFGDNLVTNLLGGLDNF